MSGLRLGISACLLGQEVRFDGGHKRDRFLTDQLGQYVEWVPVCPEVEVGMGTPREALHLVREGQTVRMVTTRTGIDFTDRMNAWAERRLDRLAREDLDGYVLKKNSPSCGAWRVKIVGAIRAARARRPWPVCGGSHRPLSAAAGGGRGTARGSPTA